jgi:hypothetical protein
MAEIRTIVFDFKELVVALIKKQDLHEGIWQLYVEFGIAAANIQTGDNEVSPSAIVPIKKIGLTKVNSEGPIAIDASKVNPE